MSTKIARMRNSQSQKPAIGNRMTYINVVQGTKIIPRIGQMIELNVKFHLAGQNSHQTMAAIRGPNRTRVVRKQHIAYLLDGVYIPW
jgi:hypothetical protein